MNKKKAKKRQRISLEEWISRMKLAFSNAKLPEINPQLSVLGYTETKLDELLSQVSALEALHQTQKKEYAEQYEETRKLEEKRKAIDEQYKTHLALCRVLFKKEVKATAALELSGTRKTAYSACNFYAQLLQTPEFLAKVKTINLKEADLEAVKTLLSEAAALKESQKKETAEAQKATETRDQAFDELYPHYADLIAYAKAVLSNEQHLEAMGIVVKR
ncbi:hypothetical protein PG592_00495 [Riemerella anatipestifer]|uniref:hypothetical protein n=1 Tax=Riemerella anatipestifer TaxID=34085 RepID=UPI00209854D9|nr:hypothetical protein [Riemerella anatipestifer]MCO7316229.1 hypothetical protein [Riemerella anatipestifer]MCO7323602.1 hypothetical protein [Riemerella anatipestifer]MCQ4063134.1 hypothetical protein [Riemerella anatipestifer]MCQ4156399.1 hypothetical protein [Riemerella anatipestifer]MCQ4172568.1 hypothetical protein [Riemerella anatipestifer]